MQIDGYVLIGGKSSRMKTNKFVLQMGRATFAERAVAALQKIAAQRVSFVVGEKQTGEIKNLLPLEVPRICDVFPGKAALGGIYTALSNAESEWAAVLACDYPFATADLFVRLAETAQTADASIDAVIPVQPDGQLQSLCAIYRVKPCLSVGKNLMEIDEVLPVRKLLENIKIRPVKSVDLEDLPSAEYFFSNINTPEDFRRAQSISIKNSI